MSVLRRVALLGAECTGKSTLTRELAARGHATVDEFLREWCLQAQRTPQAHEQRAIAEEQWRRIQARWEAPTLVADTTPLMTALYSQHYFGDATLLPWAVSLQRAFDMTLLCAPQGIPWQADAWLRDGESTRARVHAGLCTLLDHAQIPYRLVQGDRATRLAQVEPLFTRPSA